MKPIGDRVIVERSIAKRRPEEIGCDFRMVQKRKPLEGKSDCGWLWQRN